jgi:hypothetical protein
MDQGNRERTDVWVNQGVTPVPWQPPMEENMQRLTFQDGFYFGCGFFVAGIIAYLAMMVVLFLAVLVFSVAFGTSFLTFFQ